MHCLRRSRTNIEHILKNILKLSKYRYLKYGCDFDTDNLHDFIEQFTAPFLVKSIKTLLI